MLRHFYSCSRLLNNREKSRLAGDPKVTSLHIPKSLSPLLFPTLSSTQNPIPSHVSESLKQSFNIAKFSLYLARQIYNSQFNQCLEASSNLSTGTSLNFTLPRSRLPSIYFLPQHHRSIASTTTFIQGASSSAGGRWQDQGLEGCHRSATLELESKATLGPVLLLTWISRVRTMLVTVQETRVSAPGKT